MYKHIYSKMLRIIAESSREMFTTAAVCFFCAFICCVTGVSGSEGRCCQSNQHSRKSWSSSVLLMDTFPFLSMRYAPGYLYIYTFYCLCATTLKGFIPVTLVMSCKNSVFW